MAKFNQKETLKNLIETADKASATLKEAMQAVADQFGESTLLPTKQGGLNRNAFREGAKLETKQKEADRIGLSLDDAESLAWIIAGVNAHRPTLWQTYQIAYFGLDKIKPPKEPKKLEVGSAEAEREELKEERESTVELAKQYRNSAKIRRAEATIALASGDKDKAGNLKRQAEVFDKRAAGEKEKAKEITAQLVELKEGGKREKLLDKVIALRDEIKAANVLDGDVNAMTVGDLIDYLV
jgi:hypothetical protein